MSGYSRHITHGDIRVHAEAAGRYGVYRGGPPGIQIGTIQKEAGGWFNIPFRTGVSHGPWNTLKLAISRFEKDSDG